MNSVHSRISQPHEPWARWALPIVARLQAIDGDLAGAGETLAELAVEASRCRDAGGLFDASYGGLLRASVAGDWTMARESARAVRAAADAALIDRAGGAILEHGMLGVISLLAGPKDVEPLAPIEWPMRSMELSVMAWHADRLARAGRCEKASDALATIDPSFGTEVDHDGYWLATLSMLADAAYLTGDTERGAAVWELMRPVSGLTIIDPGFIYRGAAAHSAGLAAAACGHRSDATELLTIGLAQHRAHRSPWMVGRSREALAELAVV